MLSTRVLLAFVLATAVAPAATAAEPRVAALRIEGVESIPSGVLETQLFTRGPAWWGLKFWEPDPLFVPADLQEDLARIGDIYREYGYFEAQARSELAWDEDGEAVSIRVIVEEGEPVRLAALHLEIAPEARLPTGARSELVASVPLVAGEVFGSRVYAGARRALLDALAERGHPSATLEGGARVDLARHEASVEWTLHPGPLVRFGEIRISGLEDVDADLVRRELRVETGAVYSLAAQRRSEQRLRDTELFHAIAIQPQPPPATDETQTPEPQPQTPPASDEAQTPEEVTWPLEIRLRERPPRSLRVGIGYGTEEQGRASLSWRHRNFLGGGRKLELRGEYSSLRSGGEIRLLQPHFLEPELEIAYEGSGALETVPAFDAVRTEQRVQLSRPLAAPWKLRGGYRFEFADVTEVRADIPGAEASSRVSSLFAGVRRDTLDDRLAPTRGSWLDLYAEPALQAIGSSASYATFATEARVFRKWWWLVFGGRVKLSTIQVLAGSGKQDVPIFERLFSGGSTSVRGYDYQSLGPRDDDNEPLGGLSLTEASFEVRVPLPWRLSLVGFVDAGQVSRDAWTFRGRDVQFGAGPGLRLATPVGPLRFDLGLPLNPREGDAAYRIHFAVGHAF